MQKSVKSYFKSSKRSAYFVYILECKDKTLYTGTTNNIQKRLLAHNTQKTGAKYTKARRPVSLVYSEKCSSIGEALKKEHALKKLSRAEKLTLIVSGKKLENAKETAYHR